MAVGVGLVLGFAASYSPVAVAAPTQAHRHIQEYALAMGTSSGGCNVVQSCSAANFSAAAGSGEFAYQCSEVGCRLSLGEASRYLVDDGAYWTLNTGMNFAGNVVMNQYGDGEGGYQTVRTGDVGVRVTPAFAFGRIIEGGVALPNARIVYSDQGGTDGGEAVTDHPVLIVEGLTGTVGTTSAVGPTSHYEAFVADGDSEPVFRLNSYDGMHLALGVGGETAVDTFVKRDSNGSLSLISGITAATASTTVPAFLMAPANTLDTNDLILRINNQAGTSLMSVDKEGDTALAGVLTATGLSAGTSGSIIGGSFGSAVNTTATFQGWVADGASAVGVIINTQTNLTTLGAKIISVRNATVEKAYIDKDGSIVSASTKTRGTITLSGGSGAATVLAGAICTCQNTSGAGTVQCAVASTTLTATKGTAGDTDVIAYLCL
jgi:hypothetical protein